MASRVDLVVKAAAGALAIAVFAGAVSMYLIRTAEQELDSITRVEGHLERLTGFKEYLVNSHENPAFNEQVLLAATGNDRPDKLYAPLVEQLNEIREGYDLTPLGKDQSPFESFPLNWNAQLAFQTIGSLEMELRNMERPSLPDLLRSEESEIWERILRNEGPSRRVPDVQSTAVHLVRDQSVWQLTIDVVCTAEAIPSIEEQMKTSAGSQTLMGSYMVVGPDWFSTTGTVPTLAAWESSDFWSRLFRSWQSQKFPEGIPLSFLPWREGSSTDQARWTGLFDLSPSKAGDKLGKNRSAATLRHKWGILGSIAAPLLAVLVLLFVAMRVVKLIQHLKGWSDRVNAPLESVTHFGWLAIALGCLTLSLPIIMSTGWLGSGAVDDALPSAIVGGCVLLLAVLLGVLLLRLQSTLRSNRREG